MGPGAGERLHVDQRRRCRRADAAAVVAADLVPAAAGQRARYRDRTAADTEGSVVDPEITGIEEISLRS